MRRSFDQRQDRGAVALERTPDRDPGAGLHAPHPGQAYRRPGWNSWFGNADASGVLMTTKLWSAVLWQALHPLVILSKVSTNWRVSPALMARSMSANGCFKAASNSAHTGKAFQRRITLPIVPKPSFPP